MLGSVRAGVSGQDDRAGALWARSVPRSASVRSGSICVCTKARLCEPGCRETVALTENLVKVVDVMRQRLENRGALRPGRSQGRGAAQLAAVVAGCAAGYIEDHRGMCVNITSQARTAPLAPRPAARPPRVTPVAVQCRLATR